MCVKNSESRSDLENGKLFQTVVYSHKDYFHVDISNTNVTTWGLIKPSKTTGKGSITCRTGIYYGNGKETLPLFSKSKNDSVKIRYRYPF